MENKEQENIYELNYYESNEGIEPVYAKQGFVLFNAYEAYKEQATAIAEYIFGMEVTEDNVKEAKKVIAEARKVIGKLETKRKEVKKMMLEPYTDFEVKIKEVVSIIDDADREVRAKVNDLEEKERQAKKEKLRELFENKADWMIIHDAVPDLFDRWLKPYHLNKTTSIKACETDMAEWLKEKEDGFHTLFNMEDHNDYLVEYCKTLDLNQSIQTIQRNKAIKEQVKDVQVNPDKEEVGIFVITGKKNIKLVEMLLKENEVVYQFRKGE